MKKIELKGFVKNVIKNNGNYLLFVFIDEEIGEVLCSVQRGETDLYFSLAQNQEYSFEVTVKGYSKRTGNGRCFTSNVLEVKQYQELATK